jgi:hypothetical protein
MGDFRELLPGLFICCPDNTLQLPKILGEALLFAWIDGDLEPLLLLLRVARILFFLSLQQFIVLICCLKKKKVPANTAICAKSTFRKLARILGNFFDPLGKIEWNEISMNIF